MITINSFLPARYSIGKAVTLRNSTWTFLRWRYQYLQSMACQHHSVASENNSKKFSSVSATINGNHIDIVAAPGVTDFELRKAVDSIIFKQWLTNMQKEKGILVLPNKFSMKRVVIQNVDMFGERVGFLKFKADIIENSTGAKLPGIVFARGGAVAILILLECNGETHAVLTEQARVPVGQSILELPAGMFDDDKGDFVGTAAREVEEETGIKVNSDELVNLTSFLDPSTGNVMFPSPGACDEGISIFLYRGHVKKEIVESLHGRETGLRDHGELIKVHLVPYDKLWKMTSDSKVLTAIALFERARKEGLVP